MGASTPSEGHRRLRAEMRHATFIDARTGRTSRRSFSLHSEQGGSPAGGNGNTETSPLLRLTNPKRQDEYKSRVGRLWAAVLLQLHGFISFASSPTGKAVLKCALAYTLGSMCTFIPALANLLGHSDSKHTVATITVYFHPARSRGSMLKAFVCAFTAFMYTALVSVTSMGVSVLFTDYLHQVVIGHIIVLVVFVGGGLGVVGWIKLKKGDPLVNISCSLTSLSLISVLTSEGAVQVGDLSLRKIGLYLKMIVAGVLATTIVALLVFPVSAHKQFKKSTVGVTDALSDMLGFITSSFLSGNESELEDQAYLAADEQQRKSTAAMNQHLVESGYELKVVGREEEAHIQHKVAQCIHRITQSIGGLRSAAAMQFVIIKQPPVFTSIHESQQLTSVTSLTTSPTMTPAQERDVDGSTLQLNDVLFEEPDSLENANRTLTLQERLSKYRSPRQIVELFIDHLGPSMRSLAFTMKEILDELPFDPELDYAVENNPEFRNSLERALELYKSARKTALAQVYNRKDMDRNRPMEVEADWEEAAACCGHFSFSLLEVAEQLREYLVTLDELEAEIQERPSGRTWKWLKFWQRQKKNDGPASQGRKLSSKIQHDSFSVRIQNPKRQKPMYPDQPASATVRYTLKRRVLRQLYDTFSFLRRDDKKFAIKVGFGAMLYAAPSYIDATRPIYKEWRGEWGLLSYMLVCSMTIGASNTTGFQRSGGTLLGALLAVLAWHVSHSHAIPLILFGFCMAYWTAYIIVGKGKGPLGRFIMLTYNLSALYAYTLSMQEYVDDGDEEDASHNPQIWIIALHRVVAVVTGCIWGLIITRAVWPISARRKIKDGLSLLWLRMGLIWRRDPLSIIIHGESQHHYMNLREEMELQGFLTQLQALNVAAQHEFALRRPFPAETYTRILRSVSRTLEAFHTMSIVILKDLNATVGEAALLQATTQERAQLCSRISHQFSVLASSIKLEYSMASDALPSTEHTRDRLLARVFAYRKHDAEEKKTNDEDFGLLYTYALVTGLIGMEIQTCLKEIEALFGRLDEESLWLQ